MPTVLQIETVLATYVGTLSGLISGGVFGGEEHTQAAALPHLVVRNMTGNRHGHLKGMSGAATDRIQFECVAATQVQANLIRAMVNARIELLIASCPVAVGTITVNALEHELNYARVALPAGNRSDPRYHLSTDWSVSYQEPTPA